MQWRTEVSELSLFNFGNTFGLCIFWVDFLLFGSDICITNRCVCFLLLPYYVYSWFAVLHFPIVISFPRTIMADNNIHPQFLYLCYTKHCMLFFPGRFMINICDLKRIISGVCILMLTVAGSY
jgi:hypothetical protein